MQDLHICVVCGDGGLVRDLVCHKCIDRQGHDAVLAANIVNECVKRWLSVKFTRHGIVVLDASNRVIWTGTDLMELVSSDDAPESLLASYPLQEES